MDGHLTALYFGGPLAGTTCTRADGEAWSEYRDGAGEDEDPAKGDADLALVEKKITAANAVARYAARGYKLLVCPDATYYVELRDHEVVKQAAADPAVFAALTGAMRGGQSPRVRPGALTP
jgi:hypothetical protein